MDVKSRVDSIYDEIVAVRRELHAHPELSGMEYQTSERICEKLRQWGIEYKTGFADTGIVAIIRGEKPGKTIAIRGDIDALPIAEKVDVSFRSVNDGVMHACGHDIHTAITLGTGKLFQDMRERLHGNVKLFFQPAEETIGGAARMIEGGCMENPKVDVAIGLHVEPAIPVGAVELARGKMNAASTEVDITVRGISCHGAHPSDGVDAIMTMSLIITALQSFISRNIAPQNQVILTFGTINGGRKRNILADEVSVSGILRTLDSQTNDYAKKRITEIVEGVATAMGATAELCIKDCFPALINSGEIFDIAEPLAIKLLGKGNVYYQDKPSMGADDFACFINYNKGLYYNLGTRGAAQEGLQALHSEVFEPDEECIKVGMLMNVECALALLKQEDQTCI